MPLLRADRAADPVLAGPADDPGADAHHPAALLAALHAAEPSQRRQAARALAAHPAAAADLCARLAVETAASVRSVILTSLIAIRSDAVVRGLLPCLRSEDAALRNAVIEALPRMPEALAPHVRALLEDHDSDVRIFAVNVLAALAHPQAPRWLEAVLRCDPHVNVCAAAVEGLAELGDAASIPALAALPARFPGEPFIAFAVKAALARIGAG
jgi:HEAT repeat protein